MRILLTGASGFIGRNLLLRAPADWRIFALYNHDAGFPDFVSRLGQSGIVPVRCNLQDPQEVQTLTAQHGSTWDCCIYLAAKVDIPWSVREPQQDLLANTVPLLNLLESIRAGRLIYFSSGAVYDGLSGEVHPTANLAPTLPYAISKLTCERYVQFYRDRRQSIDNYLTVRFFGAYGPYEAAHKIYTRLIQAFAIEKHTSYPLYGDGRNLIDAMYVGDAIDAIQRMVSGSHWNDVVNLAGGHPIPVSTLVEDVADALGVSPVRIELQGVAHESNQFWGSTQEMDRYFGFQPRTSLAEGIVPFRDFLMRHV